MQGNRVVPTLDCPLYRPIGRNQAGAAEVSSSEGLPGDQRGIKRAAGAQGQPCCRIKCFWVVRNVEKFCSKDQASNDIVMSVTGLVFRNSLLKSECHIWQRSGRAVRKLTWRYVDNTRCALEIDKPPGYNGKFFQYIWIMENKFNSISVDKSLLVLVINRLPFS